MDVVAAAGVETRLERGLALWKEVGEYIERDEAGYWLVPSASKPGLVYRVSPADFACTCDDHRYSGHTCKHAWAVRMQAAYEMAASRRGSAREKVAA